MYPSNSGSNGQPTLKLLLSFNAAIAYLHEVVLIRYAVAFVRPSQSHENDAHQRRDRQRKRCDDTRNSTGPAHCDAPKVNPARTKEWSS